MNTTPGAPTDAQINDLRLKFGVTSKGRGIREIADVLSFARAVLSLHPAPSAALAAPVASPEPAKWIDDPHDIEQGQMLNPAWLKLHNTTAQEVRRQQQTPAPIAPSPPTTPPAAEPGASAHPLEIYAASYDTMARIGHTQEVRDAMHSVAVDIRRNMMRAAPSATSNAQGLSDAEINTLSERDEFWRPLDGYPGRYEIDAVAFARAILAATKETK